MCVYICVHIYIYIYIYIKMNRSSSEYKCGICLFCLVLYTMYFVLRGPLQEINIFVVCVYIYIYIYIYIYCHPQTELFRSIRTLQYLGSISSLMQISLNIIDILCLHIFFWIRSNSRITYIVFGGN